MVKTRQLRLACGVSSKPSPRDYLSRVVYINNHCIEYRCYRNVTEELYLNGTLIAKYTEKQFNEGDSSCVCSEMFAELTGLFPRRWDRAYRRTYWKDFQGEEWFWRQTERTRTRKVLQDMLPMHHTLCT